MLSKVVVDVMVVGISLDLDDSLDVDEGEVRGSE